MSFAVRNSVTNDLILEIQDDKVTYLNPLFAEPLKKIPVNACFTSFIKGEREKIFGNVTRIDRDHPLYPTALRMYAEAQMLTHPESYVQQKL
ncbi:MAG: hypothetical protein JJU12_03180 [Chlamydiales bacterium]|nr:hypothetical protein [Chlamydiales bacterium]